MDSPPSSYSLHTKIEASSLFRDFSTKQTRSAHCFACFKLTPAKHHSIPDCPSGSTLFLQYHGITSHPLAPANPDTNTTSPFLPKWATNQMGTQTTNGPHGVLCPSVGGATGAGPAGPAGPAASAVCSSGAAASAVRCSERSRRKANQASSSRQGAA